MYPYLWNISFKLYQNFSNFWVYLKRINTNFHLSIKSLNLKFIIQNYKNESLYGFWTIVEKSHWIATGFDSQNRGRS